MLLTRFGEKLYYNMSMFCVIVEFYLFGKQQDGLDNMMKNN